VDPLTIADFVETPDQCLGPLEHIRLCCDHHQCTEAVERRQAKAAREAVFFEGAKTRLEKMMADEAGKIDLSKSDFILVEGLLRALGLNDVMAVTLIDRIISRHYRTLLSKSDPRGKLKMMLASFVTSFWRSTGVGGISRSRPFPGVRVSSRMRSELIGLMSHPQ